jgi:hypothetical protein
MLFAILRHDAFIGRLYQYLICLMNLDFNMLTPIILYYALLIGGDSLKSFYPKFFNDLRTELLKQSFSDSFETYLTSDVLQEPYNHLSLFQDRFTGVDEQLYETGAKTSLDYLRKLTALLKSFR